MGSQSAPQPVVSVIVPARRAAATIEECLRPILLAQGPDVELIVVDDQSPDDGAAIARRMGARVVENLEGRGPAAARNTGARAARGTLLLFIDADVVMREGAIDQVVAIFGESPDLDAVFGSYDSEPAAAEFVSQYRNLLHHFIHQSSDPESRSFWAGFGAIRAEVFHAVGGFDAERYPTPSIEDIDLGRRLTLAGHRIRLEKTLQVKHLKGWTWRSMLSTDIRHRAYPWSRMMLRTGGATNDLNLRPAHRASAALVGVACLAAGAVLLMRLVGPQPQLATLALGLLLLAVSAIIALNWPFYAFLRDRRGWFFAIRAMPVHWLYYLYAALTFGWCWIEFRIGPAAQSPGRGLQ